MLSVALFLAIASFGMILKDNFLFGASLLNNPRLNPRGGKIGRSQKNFFAIGFKQNFVKKNCRARFPG